MKWTWATAALLIAAQAWSLDPTVDEGETTSYHVYVNGGKEHLSEFVMDAQSGKLTREADIVSEGTAQRGVSGNYECGLTEEARRRDGVAFAMPSQHIVKLSSRIFLQREIGLLQFVGHRLLPSWASRMNVRGRSPKAGQRTPMPQARHLEPDRR